MKNKVANVEIVPIFNQAVPGIWSDFIYIESVCDKELLHFNMPNKYQIQIAWGKYKKNFKEFGYNFAFGAYDREKMVGFAQGHVLDGCCETYLEHLYVLPKYHRCGIGTRLLKAAEQTSSMVGNKISLIALNSAVDFYKQKNGYNQYAYMEKDLIPVANSVVPVFQWVKKYFNVKFKVEVDNIYLKQNKYQPIFVHTDTDCKIDGVGVHDSNGKNKIWTCKNQTAMALLDVLNKVK